MEPGQYDDEREVFAFALTRQQHQRLAEIAAHTTVYARRAGEDPDRLRVEDVVGIYVLQGMDKARAPVGPSGWERIEEDMEAQGWEMQLHTACWVLGWQAGVNDGQNSALGHYDVRLDQGNNGGLFEAAGVRLAYVSEVLPPTLQEEAEEGWVCGYLQASEYAPVDSPLCLVERHQLRQQLAGRLAQERVRYAQSDLGHS